MQMRPSVCTWTFHHVPNTSVTGVEKLFLEITEFNGDALKPQKKLFRVLLKSLRFMMRAVAGKSKFG